MTQVSTKESVQAHYEAQVVRLEGELEGSITNEKVRGVALEKFREIKQLIALDMSLFKHDFSYAETSSVLAQAIQKMSDIVIDAGRLDREFQQEQQGLLDQEKPGMEKDRFSLNDLLDGLA